jgi:hypothetical protein
MSIVSNLPNKTNSDPQPYSIPTRPPFRADDIAGWHRAMDSWQAELNLLCQDPVWRKWYWDTHPRPERPWPSQEDVRRERQARRAVKRRQTRAEARRLARLMRLHRHLLFRAMADLGQLRELIRYEIDLALTSANGRAWR